MDNIFSKVNISIFFVIFLIGILSVSFVSAEVSDNPIQHFLEKLFGLFSVAQGVPTCNDGCPSGYTQQNYNCNQNGGQVTCSWDCYRAGGCGSYSSTWSTEGTPTVVNFHDTDDTRTFSGNIFTASSGYCWKVRLLTDYSFSEFNWKGILGKTDSVKVYSSINTGQSELPITSCESNVANSGTLASNEYNLGKGNGEQYITSAWYRSYDNTGCSGTNPYGGAHGSFTIRTQYKRASYTESDTQSDSCTINVPGYCTSKSQCGTDGWNGNPYCNGNDVYRDWKSYACTNSQCVGPTIIPTFQTTCTNGCTSGACNGAPPQTCTENDWKCTGTHKLVCHSNAWSDIGEDPICGGGGSTCSTNGQESCNGTRTLICQGNLWVDQGYVPDHCGFYTSAFQLRENQLVVMESFHGNQYISKSVCNPPSVVCPRYPVVSWGGTVLPTVVIDATTNMVSINRSIYQMLDSGSTIQIPANQAWALFYVIENNYQLPTVCNVLDATTRQCAQVNPGIVVACSDGQFDPSRGLCVVQAGSEVVCPYGGVYNVATGFCEIFPPVQANCPAGSIYSVDRKVCEIFPNLSIVCTSPFVYSSVTNKCEWHPPQSIVCNSSFIYNSATQKCEYTPAQAYNCQPGSTYNATTNLCVYTPATTYNCPSGTIYNSTRQVCEYRPPEEAICNPPFVYNNYTDRCQVNPAEEVVCDEGYNYNPVNQICEMLPPKEVLPCPVGCNLNSTENVCECRPGINQICPYDFKYDESKDSCIGAINKVVCTDSTFSYNPVSGMCEKYPDYFTIGGSKVTALSETFTKYRNYFIIGFVFLVLLFIITMGRKR